MLVLPQAYPKPISYYQSPYFSGERAQPVIPDLDIKKITLFDADERFHQRIVSQLLTVRFKRLGRLLGQYVMLDIGGTIALDQNGAPIKLNCDSDDDWTHDSYFNQVESYCVSSQFIHKKNNALENWDKMAVVKELPLLGEPYSANNYYHFCILFLPKVRYFADAPTTNIGIPSALLDRPFHRDLICMTYGTRLITPIPEMIRVENPFLMYEPFSADGLRWLRDRVGLRARKGKRLIYIARRSSMVGRHEGGILENEDFTRFLEFHGFETIDFGSGEIPVDQQIAMLDGARVVMSVHGANLTNTAFLQERISVIEILPHFWTCFTYMQIALAASLHYFGIVCHDATDGREVVVDIKSLTSALKKALEATA